MGRPLTIWEDAQLLGHSRRDFLKFCAWLTAAAGIDPSALGDVVDALETKPRIPVVWLHFQECTCCSESFIRSSHPIVSDVILDTISLDYTQTLQAAAGEQAEKCAMDVKTKHKGEYLCSARARSRPAPTACIAASRAHRARHRQGVCRRRQGDRRVGQLRVERLRAGREAEPDQRHTYPQARHRQADHQGPGMPADRGGHDREFVTTCSRSDKPPSSIATAARRNSTRAAYTTPATAVRLRRGALRRDLGRRGGAQGLLPL